MIRVLFARVRRTLKEIGRGVMAVAKEAAVGAAQEFAVGEAVQYYEKGWRYGHVAEIGAKGLRLGMVKVEHPVTGCVWVKGTDVRRLDP